MNGQEQIRARALEMALEIAKIEANFRSVDADYVMEQAKVFEYYIQNGAVQITYETNVRVDLPVDLSQVEVGPVLTEQHRQE